MKKTEHSLRTPGFLRTFFNRGPIVTISFFIVVFFVLIAIFAGVISPLDPNKNSLLEKLQGFSSQHWLGTDHLGRDVFTRLLYAARTSLLVSLGSSFFAAVVGILLGTIAGYFEKFVGGLIMRIADALIAIPGIILTLVLAAIMGSGMTSVIIAIGISMIPTYIRLIYSMVLQVKENDYITASNLIGVPRWKIMFQNLLPNVFPPAIVMFTSNLGSAIMMESGLSFLGVGIVPPTATWGSMVSNGYSYIFSNTSLAILPGICIVLVIVAFSILGDALRDTLDPRLRGKI